MMVSILALAATVSGGIVASGAGWLFWSGLYSFDRLFRKEGETAEFPDFGRAQSHRHALGCGRIHGLGLCLYLDQRLLDPY